MPATSKRQVEVYVENHGSIYLVRPVSQAAKDWLIEHVSEESQWFGGALVVEHRYVRDLVEGLREEGGFLVA